MNIVKKIGRFLFFRDDFCWSWILFHKVFCWSFLSECTSRRIVSWNTFIWVKVGMMLIVKTLSWRSILCSISYFLYWRVLSWKPWFFIIIFLSCFLPLNKDLFFFLKIFILAQTLSELFHLPFIGTIVILDKSFYGFTFSFCWLFRWNTFGSLFGFIFLLVVFQNFFVLFDQLLEFYVLRSLWILLYLTMVHIL